MARRSPEYGDASRYPAHSLYVGGSLEGGNKFREGIEWTPQEPVLEHQAFNNFAVEAQLSGRTPFSRGGSWAYENWHSGDVGDHPVTVYTQGGSSLTQKELKNKISEQMYPDSI